MSLNSEIDMYENMVDAGLEHKPSFLDCEKSSDYLLLSNDEKTIEEPMTEERIQMAEDVDDNRDIVNSEGDEPQVYFEEALGPCEEVTVDYNESSMSIPLSPPISPRSPHSRFKVNREWPQASDEEKLSMHLDCEDEKEYSAEEQEEEKDINDEDEETIATFVTAAGQQLALYAVEDSEDVFAVAVYDESGEPPTNFQFLMKSDVERLIGEGAVRTVKKPSQIKRQLLTTQPPIFSSKQRRAPYISNNDEIVSDVKSRQQKVMQKAWNNNAIINQSCQAIVEPNATVEENYSPIKQSNTVAYLMMNDTGMGIVGQSEGSQESFGSESEIVEQSTVQYILLDGDQSDSELTFDEIQATLQGLKLPNKSIKKKIVNRKTNLDQDNSVNNNANDLAADKSKALPVIDPIQNSPDTSSHDIPSEASEIETRISENYINIKQDCSSSTTQSATCGLSLLRLEIEENVTDKSSENISVASIDPRIKANGIDGKHHSINTLRPNTSDGHTDERPKIKRSRKQQLTSVNRGDSEIIIQPALIGAEEDIYNKKRGRRKKKPVPDPDYNPRPVRSKKSKKVAKNPKVEIIEIDVDEEQSILQGRNDVIEITIDDGKEKGSSDKENEIIMVGDSEDELQETPAKPIPPVMQCIHCSRSFRQKRALDTHSRVCPKSRNIIDKANKRTLETCSETSSKNHSDSKKSCNKEYTCKVCHEKFDAVVVLARHARTEHQKKYRNKSGKSGTEVKSVEKTIIPTKESLDERRVTRITQKKKGQSSNQTWKSKKLNCDDCGRWFPSRAILAAHCLQHATKNSDKQIRQCHVCKKLIKTRSLYIQHMKTHGRATRNTKAPTTVLHKKLRQTRQVTSKLTSVKKRGRPRKL